MAHDSLAFRFAVVLALAAIILVVMTFAALRWLRLSEQNFRVDKWSLCRG
jgi:hypothetical protein